MKNTIESIYDIQSQRDELISIRNSKKKAVADKVTNLSRPLNIISMFAKPIYQSLSWMPVAISVGKTIFSLLRNKKR